MTKLDAFIMLAYFLAVIFIGILVGALSKTKKTSSDFFTASKKLPWYVVGASIIAANISTEQFIGMVGWTFLYGIAIANWCLPVFISFSILIGIFLPYYMRGKITTMPEFLERRYNSTCRFIYAMVSIIGMVIALLGGVIFAGSKAMNTFFPTIPLEVGILILAAAAGAYTIYGGLLSSAWADLMQYVLLMVGGSVVAIYGLHYSGGFDAMLDALPEKFILWYGPKHEAAPWTGLLGAMVSVSVWYACANQFIVQKCLGAKSEWDARMGVVMAGFSQAVLPLIIVVPGIIAFTLFQGQISDGDRSWPYMVKSFLPSGLVGLVLAGLASAILSTISAIVTSSATIFTVDIYQRLFRRQASDHELKIAGRTSGAVMLVIGVGIALVLANVPGLTVFGLIQTVFFYIAAPIAAVFLIGILWSGATPAAATAALIAGFASVFPVRMMFVKIDALRPYDAFMHHTFVVYCISVILLVAVSFFTKRKSAAELKDVVWSKASLSLPEEEKHLNRGLRDFRIWWGLMVAVLVGLMLFIFTLGSKTVWLEAEDLQYSVKDAASVKVQNRSEIGNFNLWTGREQLLFASSAADDSITFEINVEKSGFYRLGSVVTKGPKYGSFKAFVNGQATAITVAVTHRNEKGKKFTIEKVTADAFNANFNPQAGRAASKPESIASSHVVTRIDLGEYFFEKGKIEIKYQAVDIAADKYLIGVDQFILKKVRD